MKRILDLLGGIKEGQIVVDRAELADLRGQVAAINKSQGVVEFTLDGHVLTANPNFLAVVGYRLDEIQGRHHSLFVDAAYRQSRDYLNFWARLGRGEYDAGQYKRIGKGGREVWIQASYNPVMDIDGRPFKVVKYAHDITAEKIRNADVDGQLAAINKSQGVIEFSLDGHVLTANANFLALLGYSLDEVKGKHHSLFVDPGYRQSPEYAAFWAKLGRGEYDAGQYKRTTKTGREVWIQASYNPIMDMSGKPFKVVKYASDITAQIDAANALRLTVEETLDVVNASVDGDLTRRIPTADKDGMLEALASGVNSMVNAMESIVQQIQVATSEVLSGAREIAKGNSDLSQRTEEQASSLEQTAASMEQLTSTVRQNSDNARQANILARSASEIAARGGQVVADVVTKMDAVNHSSKKMVDIISVIDGIAFQTNILALNAAVEAARAGELGRGFAVVATEVRNLAQRSAAAAKEIKGLISDSVAQVEDGSKLVSHAGTTMEEIVSAVKRVTDIMSDISSASQEQSSGIEQVTRAVAQMDEMTQQNAALVEEAAAAAESMEQQAAHLSELIGGYRTSHADQPGHPPPAAPGIHRRGPGRPVPRLASRSMKPASLEDEWAEF